MQAAASSSRRRAPTAERSAPLTPDCRRAQLVGGMLTALSHKGYGATTIADIVHHASVSKRTFYEHFSNKEACFLAAYQVVSDRTLEAIASAVDSTAPWDRQVRSAVHAYLATLEASPSLARTFMLEVHAAGSEAVALQRATHARFAQLLRRLVAQGRKQHPELRALSEPMAIAVVGGINELALVALGSDGRLRKIGPTIVSLVRAVLTAP